MLLELQDMQSMVPSGGYEDDEDHGEWFLYRGKWLNNRCCSRSNSQYHRPSNTITEPEAREILGSRSLRHCILLFLDWEMQRFGSFHLQMKVYKSKGTLEALLQSKLSTTSELDYFL